jgi:hypothetical protein
MDEALETGAAAQITQHLNGCEKCRKEYEALIFIQQRLRSIPQAKAPSYLHSLVQHQIKAEKTETWSRQLRDALDRRWSIIRTTDSRWYWTKALGTVMTSLFVLLISSVINPYYALNVSDKTRPTYLSSAYGQQVGLNVLVKLGMESAPNYGKSAAAISNVYLFNFGQSVSHLKNDDNLFVIAEIDRSGSAKIQDVLEYPKEKELLSHFNQMIATARCRPANKNGQAVSSRMILMFNQVSVEN